MRGLRLLFVLELFFCGYALTENTGNCAIDLKATDWSSLLVNIDDNQVEKEVFTTTYTGELSLLSIKPVGGTVDLTKYFGVTADNGNFAITTTADMANFDKDMPKQQSTDISGTLTISLTCPNGQSDLPVLITISDYNNHAPDFGGNTDYVYEVASPLMPEVDFTIYGSTIKVTDLDFSNQNVVFTLEPDDYFTVSTQVDSSDDKTYTAVFSTKTTSFIAEKLTYVLTATDTGTNPATLKSTATITLVHNASASLDTPTFSTPVYNFNYKEENDQPVLEPLNGNIILDSLKLSEASFNFVGDLKEYLDITPSDTAGEYTISATQKFERNSLVKVATLEVTTDTKAVTSLVFTLPATSIEFGSRLYTGAYNINDNTVNLNNPITITAVGLSGTPTVNISGGDGVVDITEYFSLNAVSDGYEIKVGTPITDDILKTQTSLVGTIQAELEDLTSYATLVINLPKTSTELVRFKEVLYTGTYKIVDGNAVVTTDDIVVETDEDDSKIHVSIAADSSYKDNFEQPTYASKKVTIAVKSDFTNPSVKIIPLVLEIQADGSSDTSSTVINIAVEEEDVVIPPIFSKSHYVATYVVTDDQIDSITDAEPVLVPNKDPSNIKLTLDNYTSNFEFVLDDAKKQWDLKLIENLSDAELEQNTELLIIITATDITNDQNTGESTLIVYLPPKKNENYLNFSSTYYNAEYTTTSDKLDVKIEVSSNKVLSDLKISLTSDGVVDITKYFSLNAVSDGYEIKVDNPITDDILKTQTSLVGTIQAELEDLTSYATLVINLPKTSTELVRFTEVLYTGTYKIVDGKAVVTTDDIIVETDEDDSKIHVSIATDSSYKDNFEQPTYANKKVTITVKSDFTNPSVNLIPLVLVIQADGSSDTSSTVINIAVESSDVTDYINFSKNLYTGDYVVASGNFDTEKISISTNKNVDEITATVYDDTGKESIYFGATYTDSDLKIAIKQPLDDTILEKSYVTIIPRVTITGTDTYASSIVNINIVKNDATTGYIMFTSALYNGNYKLIGHSSSQIECENITVETDQSDITVGITNGYAQYFKTSYADYEITITPIDAIPPDILDNRTFIPLVLEAQSTSDPSVNASTVVTLNIIDNEDVSYSIHFEKPGYTAEYTVNLMEKGVFVVDEEINVITNYAGFQIYVSILDAAGHDFAKYFEPGIGGNKYHVQIFTNDGTLPDDVVNNNNLISLILQVGLSEYSLVARTILNIKIVKNYGNIEFSQLSYKGNYITNESLPSITQEKITLVSDYSSTDNVAVSIHEDYYKYFQPSLNDKDVIIEATNELYPNVKALAYIPLPLKAEITVHGTSLTANAVFNLEIIHNTSMSYSLQFKEVLHTAEYIVKDKNLDNIKMEIITNAIGTINLNLDAAPDYEQYLTYFTATYENDEVTVKLKEALPEGLLSNVSYIPLKILATIEATDMEASAVVTIRIIESTMRFSKVLYPAEYVVKDQSLQVNEKIQIVSDEKYDNIETSVKSESDLGKYFTSKYSNDEITLNLTGEIPENELKNVSYIPLTITAVVPNINKEDSTIVTIRVIEPDNVNPNNYGGDSNSNTGYLIAVIILSLLIVALIAAAIVFYYFRLRSKDYTDVDDEFWKVRFAQNAEKKKKKGKSGDSNIENRRPTGFVFNPLEEEHDDETSTDPAERRKSVLFDDKVEKIHIEPTVDEEHVDKNHKSESS